MYDYWASAKFGPKNQASFTAVDGTRYKVNPPRQGEKLLVAIKSSVEAYILQGGIDVTTTIDSSNAATIYAQVYYPMLVEDLEDQYFSIIGSAVGTLDLVAISTVSSWTLVSA